MTPGPIRSSNSCGPVTREVGYNLGIVDDGDWIARSPSLIYFRNRLHLLTGYYPRGGKWTDPFKFDGFVHGSHRVFDGQTWSGIGDAPTNNKMALAVFNRNLWAVWKDSDKKLRYSRYYDQWSRPIEIRGQYSKSPPAIAVRGGQLHMMHQDKSSDNLWHSTFTPGRGWSKNVKIGQKSQWTPGFARTVDGRLHLVYQMSSGTGIIKHMLHSFLGNDGKRWLKPYKFSDAKTKDVPTILGGLSSDIRGRALMVHQGKSSNSLWSMLYGKTDSKRTSTKRWHDEQQLLRRKSDSPVALAWYKGCVHMVHREGKKLMHTTFSLKQAHPEALKMIPARRGTGREDTAWLKKQKEVGDAT